MILHYAYLCKAAGGVDAFLIGSELRGLTTLRSGASTYPFVDALADLAADVRSVLGPSVKLSYGADWSEYFGHQPARRLRRRPLPSRSAVGERGYRRGRHRQLHAARRLAGRQRPPRRGRLGFGRNAAYFRSNVAGGEGFDWYYASDADRDAQTRTPITDGTYGKPWVFRYKDLKGWWQHQHYDRPGGVESGSPTAWVPESKPFWFTEVGCPAVDKGANQPNVFPDPKSSASAIPYYSTGVRDDIVQRRFLEAVLAFFDPGDPDYVSGSNPSASGYSGRMVDQDMTHLWTWDARPYPAFPYLTDVWSDGTNWETGHWLTGRLGSAPASDLVAQILADYEIADAVVEELDGAIDGYLIDDIVSARQALEPLAALLLFEAFETKDTVRFVRRGRAASASFVDADLAEDSGRPLIAVKRAQETELPAEKSRRLRRPARRFQGDLGRRPPAGHRQRAQPVEHHRRDDDPCRGDGPRRGDAAGYLGRPRILRLRADRQGAVAGAGRRLRRHRRRRHAARVLVTRIEDGDVRRIEARSIEPALLSPPPVDPRVVLPPFAPVASAPEVMFLDLPLLTGDEPPFAPRVAAFAKPWTGALAISDRHARDRLCGATGDRAAGGDGRTDRGARRRTGRPLGPGEYDRSEPLWRDAGRHSRKPPFSTAAMQRPSATPQLGSRWCSSRARR